LDTAKTRCSFHKNYLLIPILACVVFTSCLPYSYAQSANSSQELKLPENMFAEISGNYVSEDGGLEITFPQGWSGIAFAGMVIVVPGGINANYQSTSSVDTAMMVISLPKKEFSNAFSSLNALSENLEENAAGQKCEIKTYTYTKINSMDGIHIVVNCIADEEGYSNIDMYGIMSEDSFILIAFAAKTSDNYDDNIAAFEQSVKTLRVEHPIPFKTAMAQVLNLKTLNHQVIAKGGQVDLKLQSNSEVGNFQFSESDKRISITVSGQDGTDGIMIISINKVLEGPYTVSIDGQMINNFVVVEDDITSEKSVEIDYKHSTHDVVITGTNVVPEFPKAVIVSILSVIGLLAVLGRTKLIASGL
jgi:hypothetical protein